MKITVSKPVEVEVKFLVVDVPVRYEEEDIPNNFPFRKPSDIGEDDRWRVWIDIDTGKITDWPESYGPASLYMKVCDGGQYSITDESGTELFRADDYVPDFFPGGHSGDYIIFDIAADGTIKGMKERLARLPAYLQSQFGFFGPTD